MLGIRDDCAAWHETLKSSPPYSNRRLNISRSHINIINMKIAVYSTRSYDREFLSEAAAANPTFSASYQFSYYESHLKPETLDLAKNHNAVCVFVNDKLDRTNLEALKAEGVELVALRCAGYNNVDVAAANKLGITVAHVPAYSPEAVAEHTVALILSLNRKICHAYRQIREGNFSLEGLVGFNLHGKTIGLVGTGRIGTAVAKILGRGFGCKLLGYDPEPNRACLGLGLRYVDLSKLAAESDIISLHAPLLSATAHLINRDTIAQMKRGVMLINTSRGGLIDTQAVIDAVKTGQIGYVGLDVYEEETEIFFEDLSFQVIPDDVFSRLLTLPDVLITGHQAFLTSEALQHIAQTTIENIIEFGATKVCRNQVSA
jgi:D-lactate dehydrogenase